MTNFRYGLGAMLFVLALPAFAASRTATTNSLSISGGIAHPSFSTAVYQNPAGLIYYSEPTVTPELALQTENDTSDIGAGLHFGIGNGSYGLSLGGVYDTGMSIASAVYGLGFHLQSLKMAFGVSGNTVVSGASGTTINAGLLFGPFERFRFGFTYHGIDNPSSGVLGLGIGFSPNANVTLVTDVGTGTSFNAFRIKPGVSVGGQLVRLMLSYGIDTSSSPGPMAAMQEGFSAGLSLSWTHLVWQTYYNELGWIHTQLSIRF